MRSKNVHCGCQVQITTFICATVPPVDVFLNKTLFSDNVEVTVSRKVEKEKSNSIFATRLWKLLIFQNYICLSYIIHILKYHVQDYEIRL